MKRQEGYYWVSILGLDLKPFWTIGKYTPAKLNGLIPEIWHVPENILGRPIEEINESRIPSPEEQMTKEQVYETISGIARDSYDADMCFCYDWFNESMERYDITIVEKDK